MIPHASDVAGVVAAGGSPTENVTTHEAPIMGLTAAERRRDSVKLNLSDEHLVAIGHVAVRAAMLDKMIELTNGQVARDYPKTLKVEALGFSTPKKLKLIKDALTKDMSESEHAISEFISEISAARYERNDIMHRIWRTTEADEVKELVDLQLGEPEKPIRRVTAKSMRDLATKMIDLTFELADWKMRSNRIRQRRFASSHGIRPPPPALPSPPRTSAKDVTKMRERQARHRAD
jgi:hypothetical protein